MDESNPIAGAIAISANRILAVGTEEEVSPYIFDKTQIIDLKGRTLMPGFVDAHSHLFDDAIIHGKDAMANQQAAIENGITSAADLFVDEGVLNGLREFSDSGQLRIRLSAYLILTNNCGAVTGDWWKNYKPGEKLGERLEIGGIKIFTDGGSCGAPAMSVDYPGGGTGDLFFRQNELNTLVADAQASGFQVAVHAAGDRALEQAQNAIANALKGTQNTLHHRIDHNSTIRPDLINRYSEIGIVPVVFGSYPTCIRTTGETRFKYILPDEFGEWDWPWRALLDANPGIKTAWHSDFPAFEMNTSIHMWSLVTRKAFAEDGSICEPPDWLAAGALDIKEVLPIMTINSAYALNKDAELGSLESGKLADMIILSDDPMAIVPDELKDIKVLMTMINGKVEYCAEDSICPLLVDSAPAQAANADSGNSQEVPPADSVSAKASVEIAGSPSGFAIDGDIESVWNSGDGPEQWLQLDFASPQNISRIRLFVGQYPAGETNHQIWINISNRETNLVQEFRGFTEDKQVLEFLPAQPLENVESVKIVTTVSPSWVAWREIIIN